MRCISLFNNGPSSDYNFFDKVDISNMNDFDLLCSEPTYYANTKIYSPILPRRRSNEIGKLYENIFEED